MTTRLLHGDARTILPTLPDASVHCVVTSPPYYALRDYGTGTWEGGDAACGHVAGTIRRDAERERPTAGDLRGGSGGGGVALFRDICGKCGARRIDRQIGLEATPEEYLATMVGVFREVRRVLRPDGVCWVNLGDSYSGAGYANHKINGPEWYAAANLDKRTDRQQKMKTANAAVGIKPKDLMEMPSRLALALQAPYYTGLLKDERDRIWLGAMVDGEGCIYIGRQPAGTPTGRLGPNGQSQRTQDSFCAGLAISNTSRAIVERFASLLGTKGNIRQVLCKGNRREHFAFAVTGNVAKSILIELYPYLVAKQHEARIAIACPPSGAEALACWSALKQAHKDGSVDFDRKPPDVASLWEPGWYLRSRLCWLKRSAMPESVTDRPASAVEYVFLLTRSARYFWDAEAVRRAHSGPPPEHYGTLRTAEKRDLSPDVRGGSIGLDKPREYNPAGRNMRNSDLFYDSLEDAPEQAPRVMRNARTFRGGGAYTQGRSRDNGASVERASHGNVPNSISPGEVPLGLICDPTTGEPLALDVNPAAFSAAHFATFPPKLVEPLIRAGTSERGCCAACGAQWVRVVERVSAGRSRAVGKSDAKRAMGLATAFSGYDDGSSAPVFTTTGWAASCGCGTTETRPCVVLDIFAGAGTTLLVADRLQRDAIGIELSDAYGTMASARVAQDAPLFAGVPEEPPERNEVQKAVAGPRQDSNSPTGRSVQPTWRARVVDDAPLLAWLDAAQ